MRQQDLVGKAQTVLGLVEPDDLGVVMPHEHLLFDLAPYYFIEPESPEERELAHVPVTIENAWFSRVHDVHNYDDQRLLEEDIPVVVEELAKYVQFGGKTLVELTCSDGLRRDPRGLVRISRATGAHIVAGTGQYIQTSHPDHFAAMSVEQIADQMVKEILFGIGDTGVRAGIMGEIGCSNTLDDSERRILEACAIAQQRTGVSISVHPSIDEDSVLESIAILSDAGADLTRTVFGHADIWCFDGSLIRQILEAGCYIEYDTFGYPGLFPPRSGEFLNVPSDSQRITDVLQLVEEGYTEQILISQDVCAKHFLMKFGGYGYAHILRDIVPILDYLGLSESQIACILVDNPHRILTIGPARERDGVVGHAT